MSHRTFMHRPLNAWIKDVLSAAAGLGALSPLAVLANPGGGQVVAGSATITSPSANGMVINQSSQSAVINWQQFSIGGGQYVQFVQPSSSAVVLNRVTGGNVSQILGNLTANGQVFLVNPNGIFFGRSATLDVQGFVGSTLDINDNDFMAGHYVFRKGTGAPDAQIVNQGAITTSRGGYVVLAGDYVETDGSINAQTGRVVLAAGGQATLTLDQNQLVSYVVNGATLSRLAGVDNTGTIVANGGGVLMTADVANALTATAVNNSGFVAAHSVQDHGGVIVLMGEGGDIENSGTLDASAANWTPGVTGGTVIIRGDGHTQLTDTSVIDTEGNGAKGGFIELSGHTLSVHGDVTTGKGGSLLIDPSKINIVTGNNSGTGAGATNSVGTAFIATKLQAGSNVAIVASNSIHNLSSSARSITATTGGGNLTMEIGTVGCPTGICVAGTPTITPGAGGAITLTGLSINIKGAFTAKASTGLVTVGKVVANGGISLTGARVSAATLSASAGNVLIVGNKTASGTTSISQTGLIKGKRVSVSENFGSSANYGGNINLGSVDATSGSVSIAAIATAQVRMNIQTGNLTATRNIKIDQAGHSGSVHFGAVSAGASSGGILHAAVYIRTVDTGLSGGGGNISGGNITATGGGVQVQTNLGSNSGGNIRLSKIQAPYISLNASAKRGADVSVGTLHATGTGTASVGKSISVFAHATGGASSSGGRITVSGSISAGHGSVNLNARGGLDSGGHINVSGAINAAANVSLVAVGSGSCCDGTVTAGNITAGNIFVSVSAKGSGGASLTVGSLKAGSISLDAVNHASGSAAITAGNIIASQLRVDASANRASGQAAHISLGSISAVNTTGEAVVVINATGKANSIITGKVNVSGHALASFGEVGPQPVGAVFQVTTHGGSSDSINIGGNVSVRALADTHGTLGDATVAIGAFAGASSTAPAANAPVTVTGNLTVNAARDVQLFIHGSVSGAVAVTAGRNINEVAPGLALNAGGIALQAGSNINLTSGSITVGTGLAPGVTGDHAITKLLGLGSLDPNAAFTAGSTVNLGNLNGSANYVLIRGSLGTLGTVGLSPSTLVQLTAATAGGTLGIGNATGQTVYSAADINRFSGFNVVLGDSAHTGTTTVGTANLGTTLITLAGNGTITGSGLLTSGKLTIADGAGTVTLTTNVASTTIVSGKSVAVDNTAFNGTASLAIGSGAKGSVSYAFGSGVGLLGGNVNINGALTLKSKGTLDLTSASIHAGGKVAFTAGQHILLGKTIVKAGGSFSANAHGSISDGGSGASIAAAGETFKAATGNIVLDGTTLNTGTSKLAFSAAGSVSLNNANIHAGSMTVAVASNMTMTGASVHAADMQVVAGGSIDLSGDTVAVTGTVRLTAGFISSTQPLASNDIILSGINLSAGVFEASAGGTIHNGGVTGTITAGALAMIAGQNINLSSTQINVGSGSVNGVVGDPSANLILLGAGLGGTGAFPNATFIAGGSIQLAGLAYTGKTTGYRSYLYIQADIVSITGTVSLNPGSLIQLTPFTTTNSIGIEDTAPNGDNTIYLNQGLLALFAGDTILIGSSGESGNVDIGVNGAFALSSDAAGNPTNLIIDTSGTVTGLGLVTSTGLVTTLDALAGSEIPPVTSGEIDPTTDTVQGTTNTDDQKRLLLIQALTGSGPQGGTVTEDNGSASVCH